jgi:uncharacterized protein YegL
MTMIQIKKEQPTNARIVFILDRSGSMRSIARDTIGGFESFLETQKEQPGSATVTLVQFDDQYQVDYKDIDINEVPKLQFTPRGWTALYDAIGKTVSEMMAEKQPEDTKTIIVILTDGEENRSTEYTYGSVQNLLKEAQDSLGWEVIFVGANIDAVKTASSLGIKASNSVTFDYTSKGAVDVMAAVSYATSSLRGRSFSYADGSTLDAQNLDMSKMYADLKNNASIDPNA